MTIFIILVIIFLYIIIGTVVGVILDKWANGEPIMAFGAMFWPITLVVLIAMLVVSPLCKLLHKSKFVDKIVSLLNKL